MPVRTGTRSIRLGATALLLSLPAAPSHAQESDASLTEQLDAARARIEAQQRQLDQQEQRLRALEARLSAAPPAVDAGTAVAAAQGGAPGTGEPGTVQQAPVETVGRAPEDYDRPLEVAVLGDQGSVITRQGQLTGELQVEYARADRNRAIFRGIEIVESVLVGVFDINESRQDILTASGSLRYGLTNRLELGVRVPYVYRSNSSVLAPIAGSTPDDAAATIDNSTKGGGLGDVELSARYQLTSAARGRPFLIANLQAVIPTGRGPFEVGRDSAGRELQPATGAGFFGISPSITAIVPTDPVVLFGTAGYTFNFADDVDTRIPPVIIDRVDPGDSVALSAGVGVAFNQRTSINLGYAHTWAFGTTTRTRWIDPPPDDPGPITRQSRDLQIGRFLFGVTYRVNERTSLNWSVEVGATEDAPDVRTVLRIPLVLTGGSR